MNIIETFLKLTSRTYPHKTEAEIYSLLPDYLDIDEFGNKYIKIGDDTTCMFTSHLDTATSQNSPVVHVIDGNICKTDGKTILGADDKAGVTIMLWMIYNKVPGLYYFFVGEEVGCVGSKALALKWSKEKPEFINKVISFDRRGTDSVITYQASSRCCSDKFATELAEQLNKNNRTFKYKTDSGGIWTDSAQFVKIFSECTNISVGYRSEHTTYESQDLEHLEKLADACLKVDWENLTVERDPETVDYKYNYGYGNYSRYDDLDDDYGYSYRYRQNSYSQSYYQNYTDYTKNKDQKHYFWDEQTNFVSSVILYNNTFNLKDIELSVERLEIEKKLIADLLDSLETEFSEFTWDGLYLKVTNFSGVVTNTHRTELDEFIPQLKFWKRLVDLQTDNTKSKSKDAWSENSEWRDNLNLIY